MTGVEGPYRPRTVEVCQCGGLLWADYGDPKDVERHVRQHQRTYRHRAWAAKQGFPEAVTPPP